MTVLKFLITKITPLRIFKLTFPETETLLVLSFSPKGSVLFFKGYFRPVEVIFVFLSNPYKEIISPGKVLRTTSPL